jgi:AAA15 family ATPase/GTPase
VLAMMLAQMNGNEKTIVIDEFDDSLHVELAAALVRIFNSTENLNQFIITTHDIQLLDSDLRIDQIYLLDKDFHGISDLKSIFDFEDARNKGRHDISFAKRYLQGRFGAVPVIDVDGLLDVLQMIHEKYGDEHGKNKK